METVPISTKSFFEDDLNEFGYHILKNFVKESEFNIILSSINEQYKENLLKNLSSEDIDKIQHHLKDNFSPKNYHKISHLVDHVKTWPKPKRVLPKSFYQWFVECSFMKKLRNIYEIIEITDEEKLGFGNIYWRIVRPNHQRDVGAFHRDSWFWEIDKKQYLPNYNFKRLKVWISINTEIGKN